MNAMDIAWGVWVGVTAAGITLFVAYLLLWAWLEHR